MKNKIKQPNLKTIQGMSVPIQNTSHIDYDSLKPAFSFEYVQKDYCLSNWQKNDIRKLIERLKVLEGKTWREIKLQNIMQYSKVDKSSLTPAIPLGLTDDVEIYYIKPFGSGNPHRIFGFKDKHNFKFLWFDKNHEVYN